MVAAYRHEDRRQGRELIDAISSGVPKALTEIVTLADVEEARR